MGQKGPKGAIKGKSLSKDANDRKYPLGFTPPVDFYINKDRKTIDYVTADDGGGSINPNENGVYITRQKEIGRGGIDITTGRHIEYGNAIVFVDDNGSPYIPGKENKLNKTFGNGYPINYSKNSDGEGSPAFTPESYYMVPDIFDPKVTAYGFSTSGGYYGASVEYGNRIYNPPFLYYQSVTKEKLQHKYAIYDNQKEYERRKFLHLLDYFSDYTQRFKAINGEVEPTSFKYNILEAVNKGEVLEDGEPRKFYLGEAYFEQTSFENEDPTYYGFDIQILDGKGNSPLLNGDIDEFIGVFGQYDKEIAGRKRIYELFKTQLMKFIKCESTSNNTQTLSEFPQPKSYYIKSISGLDKIVENFGESGESKQFVDYKKDMITLEFLEDVSQSIGYLTNLYKYMSYSRLRGKHVIPENLLRFDVKIVISDVRKFNRFVKDQNLPHKLWIFADEISRYEYTLYECQFKFDKMPHGDTVKNDETPGTEPDSYKIFFDYKFSTLNFRKFGGYIERTNNDNSTFDGIMYSFDIDNSVTKDTYSREQLERAEDLSQTDKKPYGTHWTTYNLDDFTLKQMTINNQLQTPSKGLEKIPTPFVQTNAPDYGGNTNIQNDAILQLKIAERKKIRKTRQLKARLSGITKAFDQLGKALANAAISEVNRQIMSRAAILNKTLESIRNGIPGLERMSLPRNVYRQNDPFANDILNALRAGGPLLSGGLTSFLKLNPRANAAFNKSTAYVSDLRKGQTPLDKKFQNYVREKGSKLVPGGLGSTLGPIPTLPRGARPGESLYGDLPPYRGF